MHFRDLSSPSTSDQSTLDYRRVAHLIIEQQFAPRSATDMRHIVDCTNLTPDDLNTRKAWCRRFAYGGYAVEPLDGDADQNGLRFRFSLGPVAAIFGLVHSAWGTRASKGGA